MTPQQLVAVTVILGLLGLLAIAHIAGRRERRQAREFFQEQYRRGYVSKHYVSGDSSERLAPRVKSSGKGQP